MSSRVTITIAKLLNLLFIQKNLRVFGWVHSQSMTFVARMPGNKTTTTSSFGDWETRVTHRLQPACYSNTKRYSDVPKNEVRRNVHKKENATFGGNLSGTFRLA